MNTNKKGLGTKTQIAGIDLHIEKKRIKRLYIRVTPPLGEVRVTAPLGLADADITAFIRSKLKWIQKQQQRFQNAPPQEPLNYLTGDTLLVFGRPYRLRIEQNTTQNALAMREDEIVLSFKRETTVQQRKAAVSEWYRQILKEQIADLLPKWEAITGLYSSAWQVKNMKTRWGTCNTQTKKIWLNLRLATKPLDCLEYVILHELAHLKVSNHGHDFIAIMDRYMPDWKTRKQSLNETGRA